MKPQDTKEIAWLEYGQEAYEVEMRLRELMEREYDPYWEVVFNAGGRWP